MAPQVSYEATISGTKVQIYKSIKAGICGPDRFGMMEPGRTFSLVDADNMLAELGYARDGEWTMRADWDGGLEMSCLVLPTDEAIVKARRERTVARILEAKSKGELTAQEAADMLTVIGQKM